MNRISADEIAEYLRWRLSNANAEFDAYDVAFDTQADGTAITLSVSYHHLETGERGHQMFTLTVADGAA